MSEQPRGALHARRGWISTRLLHAGESASTTRQRLRSTSAGFLFVCLEPLPRTSDRVILSAFALVDGNVLNEDFELYLSITGERTKRIGLGTFSDGADRARPMLIFANPLGISELDRTATLIHADDALSESFRDLTPVFTLKRSVSGDEARVFSCYRDRRDASNDDPLLELADPFPTPARDTRTRPRGRFTLPFTL